MTLSIEVNGLSNYTRTKFWVDSSFLQKRWLNYYTAVEVVRHCLHCEQGALVEELFQLL